MAEALAPHLAGPLAMIAQGLRPAAPPPPAMPADVSDEEINAAVARGEPVAQHVTRRVNAITTRQVAELRAEVAALRQQGSAQIAALARSTLTSRPHYAKYQREIDSIVNGLPEDRRGDASTLDYVYKTVVGSHTDELIAAAKEESARAHRANPALQPGATGRDAGRPTNVPDKDLFSPEEFAAIEMAGGIDAVARRFGFKSTDEYRKSRMQ